MAKVAIILITILALTIVSPAAAVDYLTLGVPNTGAHGLPNQHGMNNMTSLYNASFTGANVSIGNIIYPPIYEKNDTVIPWEIWLVFLSIGVVGVFGSFVYPTPEGQLIASILGIAFSSYAFILSAMIGWAHNVYNPQGMALTMTGSDTWGILMVNVIQPVYTVYSPPGLWAIMLALVFAAIFGMINATYNFIMQGIQKARDTREERSKRRNLYQ